MTVPVQQMDNITIALAGQPNTGKSTIFNQLTGARQHVGNWPGKTIEQKTGSYIYRDVTYRLVDLPGTYSLTANSPEETITRDFILNRRPDTVVVVIDAAQLKRTMYLLAEILPMSVPVIVALNMMDIAAREGCLIDTKKLEKTIGAPVIPMTASKKQGIPELIEAIRETTLNGVDYAPKPPEMDDTGQGLLAEIKTSIATPVSATYPEDWVALKLLERDSAVTEMVREFIPKDQWSDLTETLEQNRYGAPEVAGARYSWIHRTTGKAVTHSEADSAGIRRGRFDKIATHPVLGIPLALVIIVTALSAGFIAALPIMEIGMKGMSLLSTWVYQAFPDASPVLIAMIADGLVPGIGMATAFLGFMVGMFLVIGFLEDVGYMARMAFVMDRLMSHIGLHGKSFLPMFSALGCNVAGVLGSRVVDSWQQRMMTLVMAPIVPCLAVWMLISFVGTIFFGRAVPFLIIALFATLIAWLALTGALFKRTFMNREQGGLIMELPPYHKPNWKTIRRYTWMQTKSFLKRGFTLIASASLVIWALSYFPNGNIETSYIASVGQVLEPAGNLMGLDWRLMIALLSSMVAKESALATLGVLYGLPVLIGGTSMTGLFVHKVTMEGVAMTSALQSAISPASALAFIFAVFFSIPCLGTLGAIASETRSWKWTAGAASYYLMTTILFGILAYRVGLLIF